MKMSNNGIMMKYFVLFSFYDVYAQTYKISLRHDIVIADPVCYALVTNSIKSCTLL